jgi:hypothetical protein
MKVLYIHNLETEKEDSLKDWVNNIKHLNHHITILSNSTDLENSSFIKDTGIKIRLLQIPTPDSLINKLKIIGKYRSEILNILKEDTPNLIYSRFSYISPAVKKALEGLQFLAKITIPSIIEISEDTHDKLICKKNSMLVKLFYKHIQYIVFHYANLIICPSNIRESIVSSSRIEPKKIFKISGIEINSAELSKALTLSEKMITNSK